MKEQVEEEEDVVGKKKKGKKANHKESDKRIKDREENKMVNDQELSMKHRWFGLNSKLPNKFAIDSLLQLDPSSLNLYLNVSRKFIPIGTFKKYFVMAAEDHKEVDKKIVNKWGQKFREVDKVMAWLCYDMEIYKNEDGSKKNYTVCYMDRFLGIIETEVWRFHNDMDVPSHRVRMLKLEGVIIWDRKNKFSSI